MKETIIIIIFLSILIIFININKGEVYYEESFIDKNSYLVRNLKDKKKAANMLATIMHNLKNLIVYTKKYINNSNDSDDKEMLQYVETIYNKIDYIKVREASANNKYTSYSINKGEEIVFCLRSKSTNKLHNINEIMYVAIHEIAHVGCPEIGHTRLFTIINQYLLKRAVEIKVYKYVNYEDFPHDYCGMQLTTTLLN